MNLTNTTILVNPNTTNTSMSYLFYTEIYELALWSLGPGLNPIWIYCNNTFVKMINTCT